MSWYNKVVWSEGLFLHPQLFQQQERYLERFAHLRTLPCEPFFWGFGALELDTDGLALGKLGLRQASGIFADGTPFDMPGYTSLPEPLTIRPEHTGQLIVLTLPQRRVRGEELSFDPAPGTHRRFTAFETEINDSNSMGMEPQIVQVADLNTQLVVAETAGGGLLELEVARVSAVRADGGLVLDPDFVPTVTRCSAAPRLCAWLDEVLGLVHLRGEALAETLTGTDGGGTVAEVADWLLLQTLNRYEPLLEHVARLKTLAPEALYTLLLSFSGELSTFLRDRTRRPQSFPPYRHARSGKSFRALVEDLRMLLNVVFERSAQMIPLESHGAGRWTALFGHGEAERYSSLVLGVSAGLPREVLMQEFPVRTKISSPDQIMQLVRAHVPGLVMRMLPVAPRQIPFHAGTLYFELHREGPFWEHIRESGSLAMYVAGEFPALRLELWGTRD